MKHSLGRAPRLFIDTKNSRIIGVGNGRIQAWSIETGAELTNVRIDLSTKELQVTDPVVAIARSNDFVAYLVPGASDAKNVLHLIRISTGQRIASLSIRHGSEVLSISPGEGELVVGDANDLVAVDVPKIVRRQHS